MLTIIIIPIYNTLKIITIIVFIIIIRLIISYWNCRRWWPVTTFLLREEMESERERNIQKTSKNRNVYLNSARCKFTFLHSWVQPFQVIKITRHDSEALGYLGCYHKKHYELYGRFSLNNKNNIKAQLTDYESESMQQVHVTRCEKIPLTFVHRNIHEICK